MSKEFLESRHNISSIQEASKQEKQLSYFTVSKIEDTQLSEEYINQWVERNYQTNDYFLNWVKSIFKQENFLAFYKYLRYPLVSANIIKNKVEPQLKRVFKAEDSYFNYDVNGKLPADYIDGLNIDNFNEQVFRAILYKFNSIIISDLKDGKPYRYLLDINKVISIDHHQGVINRIGFKGSAMVDDIHLDGYIYIDSAVYELYDNDYKLITSAPHDLGYCPADFVVNTPFNDDYVVKESLFGFVRTDMEEYVFISTLLKMTDVNGAFPVVSMLDTDDVTDNPDADVLNQEPNINAMASQKASLYTQNTGQGGGDLQPATIHYVPQSSIKNDDGSVNMDVVKSFINFYHMPVDILKYLTDKKQALEKSIITSLIGDVIESSEESKNELQISKSISVLDNILNSLAQKFNRIRKKSDITMLGLQYGIDNINTVSIHYGTDFFLESATQLLNQFKESPNVLERKSILVRMNRNRYKNNEDSQTRAALLYDILPYVSDKDFELAKDKVSPEIFELQTRFNYWVSQFEALYGDIVTFYSDLDATPSEKMAQINNMIIDIINNNLKNQENEK